MKINKIYILTIIIIFLILSVVNVYSLENETTTIDLGEEISEGDGGSQEGQNIGLIDSNNYANLDSILENTTEIPLELNEDNQTSEIEKNISNSSEAIYIELNETNEDFFNFSFGNEEIVFEGQEGSNNIVSLSNDDIVGDNLREVYLNLSNISEDNISESQIQDISSGKVDYILFKDYKKELETKVRKGQNVNIIKSNNIENLEALWKNNVRIYSSEHVEEEIIVYSDIFEVSNKDDVKLYWLLNQTKLDISKNRLFQISYYDSDFNGLYDRISWSVPHLSEQNFLIEILLANNSLSQNLDNPNLYMGIIDIPYGRINDSNINFAFNVSSNIDVICKFNIFDWNQIKVVDSYFPDYRTVNYSLSLGRGNYSWLLICSNSSMNISKNLSGDYNIFIESIPKLSFYANKNEVNESEISKIYFNVSGEDATSIYYILDFKNGQVNSSTLSGKSVNLSFNINYTTSGVYYPEIISFVNGVRYSMNMFINVTKRNQSDVTKPIINLIYPTNDIEITSEEVYFNYNVSDSNGISNCTFSLYYYNNSGIIGVLVYNLTKSNLGNSFVENLSFEGFFEGDYSWEISCRDLSNNLEEVSRDFNYDNTSLSILIDSSSVFELSSYNESDERVKSIDDLIENINDFLTKYDSFDLEQREVVSDLGIGEDMKFYKKKLLQNKQDLTHNLNYVKEESLRISREQEINNDISDIKEKIPVNVKIVEKKEYVKNNIDFDYVELIDEYILKHNLVLSKSAKNKLISQTGKIQDYGSYSAKAKKVDITYLDRTDQITIVRKDFLIKNESFDMLIEVIPKSFASDYSELSIFNNHEVIKQDPIIGIKKEDLGNNLTYYIKKHVNLDDVVLSDSIFFRESVVGGEGGKGLFDLSSISGFFVFGGEGEYNGYKVVFSWIFVFIFLAIALIFGFSRFMVGLYRKDKNVDKLYNLIDKIKQSLKNNELELSKKDYYQAQEIYNSVNGKIQKKTYKKLDKLRVEIDRKDAKILIKECILAVDEGRKEDALSIYNQLKPVYNRLGKDDQEILYSKISKIIDKR